ncbi:hypothetical protein H8E88_18055 [candidate division KSB1 bacterium]|nr:hypothetical protein [candidate division KSB1 bacterium]
MANNKLISYIAPAAPATRRWASGNELFLRPEIGFTPKWYHDALGIDFGERWHTDPAYRKKTILKMRAELKHRFQNTSIGKIDQPDTPLDLLTGTFGACTVSAIYGIPIRYGKDKWPTCEAQYLSDEHVDNLIPPDLETNPFFKQLLSQVEWIAQEEGFAEGFINWQGVLNNAQRLRGQQLFLDLYENPERAKHLFQCVCTTMIDAAKILHSHQKEKGINIGFFTISNCLVNMVSSEFYHEFLLPFDKYIAESFGCIGVHNCAWNANPYLESYSQIPHVGYIDMGMDSNLNKARQLFPETRRAIMYTPMDVVNKTMEQIQVDLERVANEYGPCDIAAADIEAGTPDGKVLEFIQLCEKINNKYEES